MKFTPITEGEYSARNAGYSIDTNAPRVVDTDYSRILRAERGELFVENCLDSFYDFGGCAYQGDDGEAYAVEMVWDGDAYRPLCWQRLTHD